MNLGLEGKRAAVAAASIGLGYATAAALTEAGVRVAICGRDETKLNAAVAKLGGDTVGLIRDVRGTEGGAGFVAAAAEALGGLDILVTNAGGPPQGNFASTPIEDYAAAIELNLLSVIGMCHAAAPIMQAQQWGRIVAITSIAVKQPMPNLILSNTARAGATGFLKTLALEIAGDGVTVNSVLPGLHETDRLLGLYRGDTSKLAADIPAGVIGQPEDFGQIVAFLCSQHARFITGAALAVTGGADKGLL